MKCLAPDKLGEKFDKSWEKRKDGGSPEEDDFIARCESLGLQGMDLKQIYRWMLPYPASGRKAVGKEDFAEALLLGVPTADRLRIWGFH